MMSKGYKFLFLIFTITLVAACSKSSDHNHHSELPHIPPDASSEQLRAHLSANLFRVSSQRSADPILLAVKMGERNLDWLKHINSKLPADQALSFTVKGSLGGYPIDKPNRYSEAIAIKKFTDVKAQMPREMYAVLVDGAPFTDTPPIELKAYLEWGLKIDKVYQTAARWKMMRAYLTSLALKKRDDVRGYYFLRKEANLETKLRQFSSLSLDDQKRLSQWLLILCFNTEASEKSCSDKLKLENTKGRVWEYYAKYYPNGKKIFDKNFRITTKRTDISWNDSVLVYPFRDPKNEPVEVYLKTNIEDEWKWKGWNLVLKFTPNAATHVRFVPGTTPYVNGLAGSTITMDANAPLTEWDVQWTIRHEFGHSLGLPDCYIEFYEQATKEIVNYQIDTSNLMCSRMGVFQQKHYDELKRVYTKKL